MTMQTGGFRTQESVRCHLPEENCSHHECIHWFGAESRVSLRDLLETLRLQEFPCSKLGTSTPQSGTKCEHGDREIEQERNLQLVMFVSDISTISSD